MTFPNDVSNPIASFELNRKFAKVSGSESPIMFAVASITYGLAL